MKFGSLFSGIEAASIAWEPLGWRAAWLAEVDPFCRDLLSHFFPITPNLGDVSAPDFIDRAKAAGPVDLIVGGPPCQAFSVSGRRESLDDPRGVMTLKFAEVICALDPKFAVFENVPGILSDRQNAFGHLLGRLVGADAELVCPGPGPWTDAGHVAGPERAVAWRTFDAQYFGLAQRRRRVFLVAVRAGARPDPGEILFEPQGLLGDFAEVPKAEKAFTSGDASSSDFDRLEGPPEENVSATLSAKANLFNDPTQDTLIAHPLTGRYDSSEDGSGRGSPLVAGALGQMTGLSPDHAGAGIYQIENKKEGSLVRRLTPKEYERLMGFPDDYTLVPRKTGRAKDGPRYRALGNSMAVPVVRWIGERIEEAIR